MLAAYFKQYPAHLAAAARRQAETHSLPSTSPPPAAAMDEWPKDEAGAASESGDTYTLSDKTSDDQTESNKWDRLSPIRESGKNKLRRSQSLDFEDRRSLSKDRLSAINDYLDATTPSSVSPKGRKSRLKDRNDHKSLDLIDRKSPAKEEPRSLDYVSMEKNAVVNPTDSAGRKSSPVERGSRSLGRGKPAIKDGPASLNDGNKCPVHKSGKDGSLSPEAKVASRPKLSLKCRPSALIIKDKKSPCKDNIRSPDRGDAKDTKSPEKDRSPLNELFKSPTIPDANVGRRSPAKDGVVEGSSSPTGRKFSFGLGESAELTYRRSPVRALSEEKTPSIFTDHKAGCENRRTKSLTADERLNVDERSATDEVGVSQAPYGYSSYKRGSSVSDPSGKLAYNPAHVFHTPSSSSSEKPSSKHKMHLKNSSRISHDHTHDCPVHGAGGKRGARTPHLSSTSSGRSRARTPPSTASSVRPSSAADCQLLRCGVCAKKFRNPKVLPCLHTFCESCLITYTPPESLTLTCPLCRQQSILPKDGVKGLQTNNWVSGVLDILDNAPEWEPCACGKRPTMTCQQCDIIMCGLCASQHTKHSGSECHSVVSLDDVLSQASSEYKEDTTLYCTSHPGQTLRFYCLNCETAVCSSCTAIEHRDHKTLHLKEAVGDEKLGLHTLVDRVTIQLPQVKETLSVLGEISGQLEVRQKESEAQIRTCFASLQDLLEMRKTDLLNTLNNVISVKKNVLEDQKQELEEWIAGVESGCQYVEKALTNCPPMEVVLIKKQLGEKLIHYAEAAFPPVPRENANLRFVVDNFNTVKSALRHVGSIQTNDAAHQNTTAVGAALKRASVGRPSVITIITRDHHGEKVKTGGADVVATIAGPKSSQNGHAYTNGDAKEASPGSSRSNSRTENETRVVDLHSGVYEVTLTLHIEGMYQLSITLNGHHISASPFTIHAHMHGCDDSSEHSSVNQSQIDYTRRKSSRGTQLTRTSTTSKSSHQPPSHKSSASRRTNPLEDDLLLRIGRRGRNRGEFVNPQGVCYSTNKDGRIVIADSNNQCVQVFTMSGECKIKFGIRGRSAGQLQRPTGVAALPNGHYAVADYENRWVSIFEPTGKYVNRIGHGKLLGPKGLCVTQDGNIIVVDNKASLVCLFHPSGKLLSKFGNRILEGYNFAGPHFCAVNTRGDIIVTDFHNHCVRVFDSEGVSLFTFGTNGEGNGQFNAPTGVAVDDNDNIIVADWGNSRIQIFDREGSFLSFINTQADPLYGPQGLALTADGSVVVADSGNHCFKMYKYLQ